ncbi:hypothetical protein R0H17_24560 [Phytobacter diazotrophicus]|uniref:hypothetical protein n=1 Tax=Phytobacter diazotrophicus TaxID=395631 RepID=UPI0029361019|nr:hypothetical protein [Phytobacter diazotrophicus]MDV2904795.1 hypothetical protein [Phytobacter diazotrophicus]
MSYWYTCFEAIVAVKGESEYHFLANGFARRRRDGNFRSVCEVVPIYQRCMEINQNVRLFYKVPALSGSSIDLFSTYPYENVVMDYRPWKAVFARGFAICFRF